MFQDETEYKLPEGLSDGCWVHNGTWAIIENSFYMTDEEKEEAEKNRREKESREKKKHGSKRSKKEEREVNDNGTSEMWKELILEMKDVIAADGSTVKRKRKFYLADVETFKDPLVVIPNVGTTDRYLMMTPMTRWDGDFEIFLNRSHREDEEVMKEEVVEEVGSGGGSP
jgi:hypothetical protein